MAELVFLGVVNRDKHIDIPWRGTTIYIEPDYDIGQNLLVTLEIGDNTFCADSKKVELPTLEQLKKMKDELDGDWTRFTLLFKDASMRQKVLILKALEVRTTRQDFQL